MLKFESCHFHQPACRATQPSSHRQKTHREGPAAGRHDMDSLLTTIQDQYFSAVASSLSRAIVLASSSAVGQPRCQKVSPSLSDEPYQQPRSVFESEAQPEQARQAQQQTNRRRTLNKHQQHQSQNNVRPTNPTRPLDLSKRRLTDEIEPPSRSSEAVNSSNLASASSSLLFPLDLVTKTEVASASSINSGSGLIASSTVSPSSSGSPTSSLSSSSSAISSSGPLSSEFDGRSGNNAQVEALKSQDKKQQRRRPTKKLKGAKGHMCAQCGRSFSRSDMLTRHSRLHSGLKPYQCAKCLQVFSRSDHLSTHERTHTGEKPYQCKFCSYSACRRDMITRHMRTHTIGALVSSDPNSASSLGVQIEPTGGHSRGSIQVGQKSQRTRRRQNNEPDSSLEHQFFQHSKTGPTQQVVPTQIEHFHRP